MIEKLADLFENLVPIAAVISLLALLAGGFSFIATTAPYANGLAYMVYALLAAVLVISSYGLLAMIIMMRRHLKSIENKLDSK